MKILFLTQKQIYSSVLGVLGPGNGEGQEFSHLSLNFDDFLKNNPIPRHLKFGGLLLDSLDISTFSTK